VVKRWLTMGEEEEMKLVGTNDWDREAMDL